VIIEVDIYSKIRTLYEEGKSQRSIAKHLGIARQTVSKYCKGSTHPNVRKPYCRVHKVINADVEMFIISCLTQDRKENLSKQKHTAKRIYDRLVAERGFVGSYSAVREAVRQLRATHAVPAQADIPLEYDAGDAIQIDWGEATVYLDNRKIKINFFCGRLCYSCDIFVQAFFSQNQESFLEAQQRMFDYFNGIPRRLIFDNAKVAVREGFGLHARATEGYQSFASHYAFQTDFCNIASGNEKGLVENLVGYARRNFMVPVPRVKSLEVLNQMLLKDCLNYRNTHKVVSRSASVKDAYEEERHFLKHLPSYRYDTSKKSTPIVGDYSTVRFDKNDYSVPIRYLRKRVTVKGYANEVQIYYEGELTATFVRVYGSGKTQYCLEHYLDLLERKPRAVFQAKPVRQNVAQELLDWGKLFPGGNKDMVRLLRLCVEYGEERILSIREQLPTGITPTIEWIRSQLNEPLESNIIYLKDEIPITQMDLRKYDEKCGVTAR